MTPTTAPSTTTSSTTTSTGRQPSWPPPVHCRPYGMIEFRAMASPCRIVTDTIELATFGREVVDDLERRWSRFIADSEVSRINAAPGAVHRVSSETFRLFERAEFARVATSGRFNPFVLERLVALGDGRDRLDVDLTPRAVVEPDVLLLDRVTAIHVSSGGRFDPGGIGKGLAGDIVVERLIAAGATSIQVELGGDVRVAGRGWRSDHWEIEVVDPHDRCARLGTISLAEGAVATSSVLGRRWRTATTEMHHIVDPATGLPSASDLVAVTATSSELWWAEIVAKVALLAGSADAPRVMADLGATGLLVRHDGSTIRIGGGM